MKITFAALWVVAFVATPASANQSADQCRAYISENGGDPSGCDCLGDAAAADQTLADALSAIESPEDLDAASDDTKAAIAACFPSAQQG